jgi:hypothetical protein
MSWSFLYIRAFFELIKCFCPSIMQNKLRFYREFDSTAEGLAMPILFKSGPPSLSKSPYS